MNKNKFSWEKRRGGSVIEKEIELPNGAVGWIVIDSRVNGSATGGVRWSESLTLSEVRELAAEMTMKFSFYNLPIGGAKSGIQSPLIHHPEQRDALFSAFGQSLSELIRSGAYRPGQDMGTTPHDIRVLRNSAGNGNRKTRGDVDSGYFTAVTVHAAVKTVTDHLGLSPADVKIGIQGIGKVGGSLIRLSCREGMTVVGVSTLRGALYSAQGLNGEKLLSLAERYGDELVFHYDGVPPLARETLETQVMDVFCPCAGSHPIHAGNVEEIQAKIIVCGCNVGASAVIEERLSERNIHFLPGFVSNSGGVLGYILADHGFNQKDSETFLTEGIRATVRRLIRMSGQDHLSYARAARRVVAVNQDRFEKEAKAATLASRAIVRFRCLGIKALFQSLQWRFLRPALFGPPSATRSFARNILFNRLFSR